MINPILKGNVSAGKIKFDDEEKLRMHLASFMDEARVEVIIRKARSKATAKQYGYLFGVVLKIISDETGHSVKDLYVYYKAKLLQKRVEIFGKIYTVIRGLSDLNTKECVEFIREIKMDAATTLDIFIPDVDSVTIPDYF